jgi:hypothetical protein
MRRAVLPLLLLFPLTIVGCGSSSPTGSSAGGPAPGSAPGGGQPSASAAGSTRSCPDSNLVGSHLGATLDARPDVTTGDTGVVCMYHGHVTANNDVTVVEVSIRDSSAAEMTQLRKDETDSGHAVKDLPGLGDVAITFDIPAFRGTITNTAVLNGARMVYVAAEATVDQEVTLIKVLMTQ